MSKFMREVLDEDTPYARYGEGMGSNARKTRELREMREAQHRLKERLASVENERDDLAVRVEALRDTAMAFLKDNPNASALTICMALFSGDVTKDDMEWAKEKASSIHPVDNQEPPSAEEKVRAFLAGAKWALEFDPTSDYWLTHGGASGAAREWIKNNKP